MPIKILNDRGDWLIQVQRDGVRHTQRGQGGEVEAKKAEALLLAELDQRARRQEAAQVLGLEPEVAPTKPKRGPALPTLAEYLTTRWASHAALVQNDTTRRTTACHVRYLAYFLGDRRLDEISTADVNEMIETMHRDGPLSFKLRQDGQPRQRRYATFTPTSINRILETLKASLRLAASEGLVVRAPTITLLPMDHSKPIVPPSEEEFDKIVEASKGFLEIGPYFPEVIELAAETGLREAELFYLTWRSVDLSLGDTGGIRVEEQPRTRVVAGKPWKPKHLKSRVVPLTPRARQVVDALRERVPHNPTDLVIPNRGGCPYVRIEHAPERAGKGWWHDVLDTAGLRGKVRFHDLRHLFAVRCLQRGLPLPVVSAWLGHSDVNLTVKRYGRWSSEAKEHWQWIKKLGEPIDTGPTP